MKKRYFISVDCLRESIEGKRINISLKDTFLGSGITYRFWSSPTKGELAELIQTLNSEILENLINDNDTSEAREYLKQVYTNEIKRFLLNRKIAGIDVIIEFDK
ncbi:MAG: hypothetical protein KAS32_19525 [Candidatus Peribacteraceae bacterium]|nr:hypothetical protein [Candidatus Peribacteraceae bacterium]